MSRVAAELKLEVAVPLLGGQLAVFTKLVSVQVLRFRPKLKTLTGPGPVKRTLWDGCCCYRRRTASVCQFGPEQCSKRRTCRG